MPGDWAGPLDPALSADHDGRRGCPDPDCGNAGVRVRTLWLSAHLGSSRSGGLESEPEEGGADLAARRTPGTPETTKAGPAVASGRFLSETMAMLAQPCLGYDFVEDRTHNDRKFRMLTVIDEFSRECLAIEVARRLTSDDVLDVLTRLMTDRGPPDHIRSDQGVEFAASPVRRWLSALGVKTAFIEKASPWENGYNESFNGKLRDELLNGEIFYTLVEAKILIERWRRHYNQVRPHSALGYRPPAPAAIVLQLAQRSIPIEAFRVPGPRAEINVRLA